MSFSVQEYILREKVEENPGTGKGIAWICLGLGWIASQTSDKADR